MRGAPPPNCTLVELKWINLLQQSRTLVSKLYLSGIEIMGRGDSVLLS